MRLPVVERARSDTHDIADGQDGQQFQAAHRIDDAGEVTDRPGVRMVPFLRRVRHQQVVLHQPDDGLGFFLAQAQTGRDHLGDLCAYDRMVLGPTLSDIVQQQRHIEHAPVDPGGQNVRGDRVFLFHLALFKIGKDRDALDDVLVHRVLVVHVELHQGDHALEFRDELAQYSQFVHPPERTLRIAIEQ